LKKWQPTYNKAVFVVLEVVLASHGLWVRCLTDHDTGIVACRSGIVERVESGRDLRLWDANKAPAFPHLLLSPDSGSPYWKTQMVDKFRTDVEAYIAEDLEDIHTKESCRHFVLITHGEVLHGEVPVLKLMNLNVILLLYQENIGSIKSSDH